MTIYKYVMKCIYKTAKVCFVTSTQHCWLFLGRKILLFRSSFITVATIKMPDFTWDVPRQWVNLKLSRKFLECVNKFALSWEHFFYDFMYALHVIFLYGHISFMCRIYLCLKRYMLFRESCSDLKYFMVR